MLKKLMLGICALGFVGAVTLPLATPAEATFWCKKGVKYKKGSWCDHWSKKWRK